MVHVERSLCRDEEQRCVLGCALRLGVQIEQRILGVVTGVLVEAVVVLFLQGALAACPQSCSTVDLLDLVLGSGDVVLVIVGVLVIGQIDRVSDMVAVLLDQVLDLPPVAVFLAFVVQIQHDCGTAALTLGLFYSIFVLSVADPLVGLLLTVGLGRDLDLVCHHEGGIETNTELSDEVAVLLLVLGQALQEALGSRAGNRAQVVVELIMAHSDTVIGDRQRALVPFRETDVYAKLAVGSLPVHQRAVLELVQRIRCIGHQLAQEDFLM